MPLPTIADTARIAVNFESHDGIKPVNVHHVSTGGQTAAQVGQHWWESVVAAQYGVMPADFEPITIDVTLLDGSSGAITVTRPDFDTHLCSEDTGEMVPEAAAVLKFGTGLRGPANRGRVFIGPVLEAGMANGFIETAAVSTMAAAWQTFAGHLISHTLGLVVASYTHSTAHAVTSITGRTNQCTQRRRLLQQRH